jgi:tetratricopeptide (TPR) repeat protein
MARFRRPVWNELQGLTPQEAEVIKRYEADPRGSQFVAAAEILRKRGYIEEAIVIMEDGVKVFPQYHSARASLGRDYFLKGMMQEARNHIENVVARSIDNTMAQRMKLKLDIVFNDKDKVVEQLALMKKLIPDDDSTKSIRDLVAVGDWEGCKALVRSELDRLGICWSPENNREKKPEIPEKLQPISPASPAADWEIPGDSKIILSEFSPLSTNPIDTKELHEAKLPPALRSGDSLAFVRGDTDRYLVLKGFRRLQSEGLFCNSQHDSLRRHALDATTLAEIYVTQGLVTKAIAIYEKLVQQHPEVPSHPLRLKALQEGLKNKATTKPPAPETKHPLLDKATRMTPEQEKKLRLLENLLTKLDSSASATTKSDS